MRLLLAEDEKALSSALQVILKHNNYSVDAVYNGQDAGVIRSETPMTTLWQGCMTESYLMS